MTIFIIVILKISNPKFFSVLCYLETTNATQDESDAAGTMEEIEDENEVNEADGNTKELDGVEMGEDSEN